MSTFLLRKTSPVDSAKSVSLLYPTVCYTPLFVIPHCLLYPTVCYTHCLLYPTVCYTPLFVIPHCLLYPTVFRNFEKLRVDCYFQASLRIQNICHLKLNEKRSGEKAIGRIQHVFFRIFNLFSTEFFYSVADHPVNISVKMCTHTSANVHTYEC